MNIHNYPTIFGVKRVLQLQTVCVLAARSLSISAGPRVLSSRLDSAGFTGCRLPTYRAFRGTSGARSVQHWSQVSIRGKWLQYGPLCVAAWRVARVMGWCWWFWVKSSIHNLKVIQLVSITGWWFGTFFIFHNIWDNPSHWLIFFKMVKTTNQISIY